MLQSLLRTRVFADTAPSPLPTTRPSSHPVRRREGVRATAPVGEYARVTPEDIVHGEQLIPGADDWGYGPPCYLTPERVRIAAESLPSTSFETLVQGVTPEELSQADVYPQIWSDLSALDYVRHHHESLSPFFAAAAEEGDAVLVWLD
ncbi:YfbM family protein [Streptomyces sp. KM273126]|nr:YfbM family protein [Streptomyces sp. KM273126]